MFVDGGDVENSATELRMEQRAINVEEDYQNERKMVLPNMRKEHKKLDFHH